MEDFAPMIGIIHYEVFTLLLVCQINSTDVSIIVGDWEDVYLQYVFVDLSEALDEFFFELFFSFLSIFEETLCNERKIWVVLLVVEKEPNFGVGLVQNAFSYFLIVFVGLLSIIKLKKSAWKYFVCFIFLIFGIDDFLLFDENREVRNIAFYSLLFQNLISLRLCQIMQLALLFLVVLIRDKIYYIEADFSPLLLHVSIDFNANSFELLT